MPPSSDPPSAPKRKTKGKKNKRKRGGQKGHKGSRRTLIPEDKVDKIEDLVPCACERCGSKHLHVDHRHPWRHQVVEIAEILSAVVEYRIHSGLCGGCGHRTKAALPKGVTPRNFGPRLESFVAFLSGGCHLSKRHIQELLDDVFGVSISLGAITECESKVCQSLEAAYEEAHLSAQDADVAHADESGWREGLSMAWLWVLVTTSLVVFRVDRSRSQEAAKKLLKKFTGTLVCDRYGGYNIHQGLRQFCWAHLLRKFYAFAELPDEAGKIGEDLVEKTLLMFHWLNRVRDGTMTRKKFKKQMQKNLIDEIEAILRRGQECGQEKMAGTCKRILKTSKFLWTFVEHEQVPPTNNDAERAIRKVVLWRKGSFGTQSSRGSRFAERVLTVVGTCKRQERSVFKFLTASRFAHLNKSPYPSLLPAA
jgi:hypothetical protein